MIDYPALADGENSSKDRCQKHAYRAPKKEAFASSW